MMPSIELRLRTMAKAMTDVILPALSAENALAREQAQLVIAQLGMIAEHWRRAAEHEASELRELTALGERLSAIAAGGAETRAAADALAALLRRRGERPPAAVDEDRAAVASAIDALIRASGIDGDEAFGRSSCEAILDHAALQARRDRIWFAGCGMDPERASFPGIDEMLAEATIPTPARRRGPA